MAPELLFAAVWVIGTFLIYGVLYALDKDIYTAFWVGVFWPLIGVMFVSAAIIGAPFYLITLIINQFKKGYR